MLGTAIAGGALAVLLFVVSGRASATTYHVAPTGDDSNSGTSPEQAWKTLEAVNSREFGPGDRILFRAGGRFTGTLMPRGSGAEGRPIVVDRYGEGPLPRIEGGGKVEAAVHLFNVEHWELARLDVSNSTHEPPDGRCNGVFVHLKDFGTARGIGLKDLYVHDVAGKGGHNSNSGDGISWLNEGENVPSRFDGLRIEACRIARTHLNGIWGWSGHWSRCPWYPSLNVVIRDNAIEDVGGSGIVPVGCDGAVVEHNRVVRPSRGGTGIGIWPWSCDNTLVQFNEVSGADGTHDGQAFDSDWNCRNTTFQYNYSHDNPGGFMLVCTRAVGDYNVGCEGTVVRYNISENDGGTSTQVILLAGPCRNTYIYNNTIYTGPHLDVNLIEHWDWEGLAEDSFFFNNAVYADGRLTFDLKAGRNHAFGHNAWYGNIVNRPCERGSVTVSPQLTHPGGGGIVGDTHRLSELRAYRLRVSSPLIDRGADLRTVLGVDTGDRDYYGNAIPGGEGFDIGAHEAGGTHE